MSLIKTNLFSAAVDAAGFSNCVSGYGSLHPGFQIASNFYYEWGQGRLGTTLWKRPGVFIDNSPLFAADKIFSPLLIMHNREDGNVPWSQGVELYTALKRLNKSVWMLQYDNEVHVFDENSRPSIDFTIRVMQFFDHYLKNAPPARWMTQRRLADQKTFNEYLDLDINGSCSDSCKVCGKKLLYQHKLIGGAMLRVAMPRCRRLVSSFFHS